MATTSYNSAWSGVVHVLCALSVLLPMAGCGMGSDRIYPVAAGGSVASDFTRVYVYPPVPQIVTVDTWEGLIARYRGQPLLLCLWRVADPNVVAGLHQASEVLAQYSGSCMLGVNLDSPDVWLSAAIPTLRQAQTRFPVVTIPDSQRAALLAGLGLPNVPAALTYVVLDAEGKRIAIRTAFEPVMKVLVSASTKPTDSSSSPVTASPEQKTPAAKSTEGAEGRAATSQTGSPDASSAVFYALRVLRLADSAAVGEVRGVGHADDLFQPAAAPAKDGAGQMAGWMMMAGLQVVSYVPRGERVAVAPIRCSAPGQDEAGLAFGNALAEAIKANGRGVVGPTQVGQVLHDHGISQDLFEMKPSAVGPGLDAAYIVVGTISLSKAKPSAG